MGALGYTAIGEQVGIVAPTTSRTSPNRLLGLSLGCVRSVTSTESKAKLNALLAEVERTGISVTITKHGRPAAVLTPAHRRPRKFGQLPALTVRDTFNDPLPEEEIAAWQGNS